MINHGFMKTLGLIVLPAAAVLAGCQAGTEPRMRHGAFFGEPAGIYYPEPDALGHHCYDGLAINEVRGMVYTCRGGFIDIGHVREGADRTAFLSKKMFEHLMLDQTEVNYQVIEPSQYKVTIVYPPNWETLSFEEKRQTAFEISIRMGQYLAHTSMIWHEMLTWYGFSTTGIFPEYISSFSWEDPYSDLLGTTLAVEALCDTQHNYDDAMTLLLSQRLRELGAQPPEAARQAEQKVFGSWYTGENYFWVTMKKRSFDVGFETGFITPWLVPGICQEATPQPYPAADTAFLSDYGFGMRLEIHPLEFEKRAIYRALELHTREGILPPIHFPRLLEQIKKDAIRRYGADVDHPDPVESAS